MIALARQREITASWLTRTTIYALAAIVFGTLARLALLQVPAHGMDSWIYRHWTWRLVHKPIRRFYVDDGQAFPDHLPGDMWLLKLLGELVHTLHPGVDFYSVGYTAIIAGMVTCFDALLAVVLWRAGSALGSGQQGAIAGLAYWCLPAPIFVGSVWGQTDGISAAIAVVALTLAIRNRHSWAFVALTFCVLVKPQYGLLALPLLAAWWYEGRTSLWGWVRDVATTAVSCVALVNVLIAPFDMSIAGEWGRWNLLDRIRASGDLYPQSVFGAHNLWGALYPLQPAPDDHLPWQLGLSRQSVGLILFAVIVGIVCWALVRRWQGATTLVLASNVLMFGFFLVTTRMHERYLFPVLGMSLLLALLDSRYWRYAIAVNGLVFANVALRYVWPLNDSWTGWGYVIGFGWLEHPITVWLLVLATCGVFVYLILQLFTKPEPTRP